MPDKVVVGLSVGVGLLGAGLIATLLYFLLLKKQSCPACDCYASAVSEWEKQ